MDTETSKQNKQMNDQASDFSALVQELFAAKAKTDSVIKDMKGLAKKTGHVRRSLEKMSEAMSEENTVKAATKAASKRRKKS